MAPLPPLRPSMPPVSKIRMSEIFSIGLTASASAFGMSLLRASAFSAATSASAWPSDLTPVARVIAASASALASTLMASALLLAAWFSASAITVIGIASVSAAFRAAITLMILSRSAISTGVAALHREIGLDLSRIAQLISFGLLVGDRQFLLDSIFGLVLHCGLLDLRG